MASKSLELAVINHHMPKELFGRECLDCVSMVLSHCLVLMCFSHAITSVEALELF